MADLSILKNCRIIIKKIEDNSIIADTTIKRYESSNNSVVLDADSLTEKRFRSVYVLIFGENNLYEFSANIKGSMIENEVEVLLGKRKKKEDRKRTRYPLILNGVIDTIKIKNFNIRLRKPMKIKTINMSSIGVLFSADLGCLEVGSKCRIVVEIERKALALVCEVVRIHESNTRTEKYACKILEIRRK